MIRFLIFLLFSLNVISQEIPLDEDILKAIQESNIDGVVVDEPVEFEEELEEFRKSENQDYIQNNSILVDYLESIGKS